MRQEQAIATVIAWQEAVNGRDFERLVALSDPDIEIVGPRGVGRGHHLLRAWLDRAGIHLATDRLFARGEAIVVAQRATWRAGEDDAATSAATVASAFRVADGRVTRVARHDLLADALADVGLGEGDEQVLVTSR